MKSQTVLRLISGILLLVGLLFPVQRVLSLIVSLINPATKIRPEWVQDLESVKYVLIVVGVILFASTFIKTKFARKRPELEVTGSFTSLVFVILVISLIICTFLAFRPVEVNIGSLYQDDFFYFLKIAENTLRDGRVTLDGTNVTNGFQPLWMLILMLLTAIISDKLLLMKMAGFLLALCHVGTAYFLYRIALLYKHEKAGVIVAFLWAFNPFVIGMVLSGFETGLYLLLIAVSVWYYLKHRNSFGYKQSAILGVLLGLTFWARLDAFFLVAAIGIDYIARNYKKFFLACKKMVPAGAVFSMFAIPWFWFSLTTSHTLTPISGTAKMFVSTAGYYSSAIDLVIKRGFTFLAIIKQGMGYVGFWYVSGFVITAALAIGWLLLVWWLLKKTNTSPRSVLFLIFYSLALFGYYLITSIDVRYIVPAIMLGILGTALVVAKAYHQHPRKVLFRRIVLVLMIILLVNMGISAKLATENDQLSGDGTPLQYMMYEMATGWMRTTPPDTVFAGVNAGVYAYFSGRKVVNLDGVISNNAYHALREYRVYDYIREQGVDYVVDWDYIEDFYLKRFGGEGELSDHLTPISRRERKSDPYKEISLVTYKVKY